MTDNNTNSVLVNTCKKIHNYRGQVTGTVRDGVYYRTLASNHILRVPPAIAISIDVIEQLKNLKVEKLEFVNRDSKTIYRSSLAHFVNNGFIIDRGAGVQFALPLAEFDIESKNATSINHAVENVANWQQEQPANAALQLSFGGWR